MDDSLNNKPRRLKAFRRPVVDGHMLCRFNQRGCGFSFKLDTTLPESRARRKATSACWNHEERTFLPFVLYDTTCPILLLL
jgi:hypothetical protein